MFVKELSTWYGRTRTFLLLGIITFNYVTQSFSGYSAALSILRWYSVEL
jgi:hypothetical protein